jgi:hypothetical protein
VHPSFLAPPAIHDRRALLDPASGSAPSPDPLDPLLLAEIAAGLAQSLGAADRVHREPQLLLRTRRYAAWRLDWPPGAAWDCNDRDPGVLHVVRGELLERWTHLLHLDSNERVVRAGDSIALGGSLTSHIENRSDDAAVLVHVASPATVARPCEQPLRLVS